MYKLMEALRQLGTPLTKADFLNAAIKTEAYVKTCTIFNHINDKTLISTCLGVIFVDELCKLKQDIKKHPNEKGHPDIVPIHASEDNHYDGAYGFDVKVTCGDVWSAHHQSCKNLLGIVWRIKGSLPVITKMVFIPDLNENDWTKPKQTNEHNTPSAKLKIQNVKSKCITILDKPVPLSETAIRYNKIMGTTAM